MNNNTVCGNIRGLRGGPLVPAHDENDSTQRRSRRDRPTL